MTRHLILVLGDQLDPSGPAFQDADADRDIVAMAEVEAEVRRHPNHRQRVALFFAAMRHFRDAMREKGFSVAYQQIGDASAADSLPSFLEGQVREHAPEGVVMAEAGRYELERALRDIADQVQVPIDIRTDTHFLCTRAAFADWADGRKALVMEHFYRTMRKRHGYLVQDGEPAGGAWNFDKENREAFGERGPQLERAPYRARPDEVTQGVFRDIDAHFPDLYGSLDAFDWPVTPAEGRRALNDFIEHRLARFGTYQDAMWTDEPYLYHARLSAALNLKLLDPRFVVEKAIAAYEAGEAPINAVEGFIRQVIGWREFMRGIYWFTMPGFEEHNALEAHRDLPAFFWTGETDMACIRQVVLQLLETGYAHHIQRLMVTGLFALLYGVEPRQVHAWYMAMFVDAVEWVTLPNTVGMSQYADGGVVGTKPYVATGKYIKRQSNYCDYCPYNPDVAVGEAACPFTTLYWSFLMRHEKRLEDNHRMGLQLSNLRRKAAETRDAIADRAASIWRRVEEGRRV